MHQYTVHHDDKRHGPMPADELVARYRAGEFPTNALVWRPGLAEWGALTTVLRADGVLPPEVPLEAPPIAPLTSAIHASSPEPKKPYNWLIPAIISTLCGCLPLGIVAIVFAAQVDGKHRAGDHAGAQSSATVAKVLTIVGLCLAIVTMGFYSALAIPAFTKVRNNAIEKCLINDARQISSAANQVMAEEAKTEVTLGEVRKYIPRLSSGVTLVISGQSAGDLTGGESDKVVLRQTDRFSLRHLNYRRDLSNNPTIQAQSESRDTVEFEVSTGAVSR